MNIHTHLRWGEKILAYFKEANFSQISTEFVWDKRTQQEVQEFVSEGTVSALSSLEKQTFPDLCTFEQKIHQHIGNKLFAQEGDLICLAASVGRRMFIDKLGWIIDYQSELVEYSKMIELVHLVQKQVKQQGLNKN